MNEHPAPTGVTEKTPEHVSGETTYVFAGIGKRFLALLIDGLVLSILNGLLSGGHYSGSTNGIAGVLYLAYGTVMLGQYGQTVGKMAMRIRVVSTNGEKISFGTAFVRVISTYLSSIVLFIGYIWAFFNPKHQTWHDLIANTYVVEDTSR